MQRLLIIDDNKTTTRIVLKVLNKRLGVDADLAMSLKELKGLLDINPASYTIAICDYNLPDAPNGEAIDYVISRGIPTIVLTATFDTDLRDKMLSKRIVDYVVKRSTKDLDYLASTIRRVLKNQNIKVLVVDDSSTQRDIMGWILTNQLYNVLYAKGGREALDLISQNPDISLVITDYNMPDIDGLDLLTSIRKKFRKEQMAVLVVSGIAGNELIPNFLKAGANDYIHKPFCTEEFVCRVNMNIETLEMINTLRDFANKDPLTGLYNRRYLYEAGTVIHATALRNKVPLAVFMFDIDKFKAINDTYGHDAGDLVIRAMATILSGCFKRKTDIVARFGGEEFCVLTSYDSKDALLNFADNIRKQIEQNPLSYSGKEIKYTTSVGVCSETKDTVEDMIKEADALLYLAKTTGRNRVCF
jgi:diguanylate cyclase (GGDEF)-like protein